MPSETIVAAVIGDVALIVVVSWLFGAVARRWGQPTVIGQIVAGIALGPTLLGQLPGNPTAHLFPAEVRPYLSVLAQVAVVVFMFVAGYEIDFRQFRGGGRAAGLVAIFALLVPMGLSTGAVALFHGSFAAVDPEHVNGRSFVLFMAVATSITALPVLAAIVRERGAAGTRSGTIATAAAGFMDLAAWLVLAAALAGTGRATRWSWPITLLLMAGFIVVMFALVRPAVAWWIRRPSALFANQVPVALGLAFGSAWVTASLGLHPIFGAFLAGIVMPSRDGAQDPEVLRPMEQCADMLLPLFFVVTGLSFNIGSVDRHGVLLLALILVIAIGGKVGPAYLASRVSGLEPKPSALVATLVNTRGLTELIALNVGLAVGIIGPELFAVLVLMALITTFMTGPLLTLIGPEDVASPGSAPLRETSDAENIPSP